MHHIELGPWNHVAAFKLWNIIHFIYLSVSRGVLSKSKKVLFSSAGDFLIWSVDINNPNLWHLPLN